MLSPRFELPFAQGTATKFSSSEENDGDGQLPDIEHASNGQLYDIGADDEPQQDNGFNWSGNGAV